MFRNSHKTRIVLSQRTFTKHTESFKLMNGFKNEKTDDKLQGVRGKKYKENEGFNEEKRKMSSKKQILLPQKTEKVSNRRKDLRIKKTDDKLRGRK